MNDLAQPLLRFRDLMARAQATASRHEPPWLLAQRSASASRFERLGFPTRKQEAWRYTNVEPLLREVFVPASADGFLPDARILDDVLVPDLDAHRLVFINGHVAPEHSSIDTLPRGVTLGGLRDALARRPATVEAAWGRAAGTEGHVFNALNGAAFSDGPFIHVAAERHVERPIEVLHVAIGREQAMVTQPRALVIVEAGARLTLIERYVAIGEPLYFTNGVTEILLGERAALEHYRVQSESSNAFHIGTQFLTQAEASSYHGLNIALGGAWSRSDLRLRYSGERAQSTLDGLYVAGDKQLVDVHLDVEHALPACTSREHFRGILTGRGRAVFDGRVLVARDAQHSDAQLNNANLLLSRDAEVDTKPQLEIYADDVKCSHGTTVGQLDPAHLFYLRSRGIDEPTARRMLCLGFAEEILAGCGIDVLRAHLEATLTRRLDAVATLHEAA